MIDTFRNQMVKDKKLLAGGVVDDFIDLIFNVLTETIKLIERWREGSTFAMSKVLESIYGFLMEL